MPLPHRRSDEPKPVFLDRCMADPTMRREFPESDQRYAVCQRQARPAMQKAVEAAVALLAKETGVAEVDAAARLVERAYARHWRRVVDDAIRDFEARVRDLADDFPTPDVDVLVDEPPARRQRVLDALVAALVAALEARAAAPPPASLQALIRRTGASLAAGGAAAAGLELDAALPEVQAAIGAAELDLPLLAAGRATWHREEVEAVAEAMLTSRTARTPGAGAPGPALPGAPATLEDSRAALRAALGGAGGAWLEQVALAWAYRWRAVGAFLAARAAGVALYVWNNPPRGPDVRTTPFCKWLHGRRVATGRAALQVDRYVRAVLDGDTDGMRAAWPLDEPRGDEGDFALRFAGLGLPPYHFGCRDVVLAERPAEG